jgi:hypothetical protein
MKKQILALSTSIVLLGGLTACASGTSATTQTPTSSTESGKDAHGILRSVNMCFLNTGSETVDVTWSLQVEGRTGSGALAPGQKFCGEGTRSVAAVTFPDGFTTTVTAQNFPILLPEVLFQNNGEGNSTTVTYASASYYIDESIGSDVEGHPFSAHRGEDTEWINFEVNIGG